MLREVISELPDYKFISRLVPLPTEHRESIILESASKIETYTDLAEYLFKNNNHLCETRKEFYRYLKFSYGIFDNNIPKEILINEFINKELKE